MDAVPNISLLMWVVSFCNAQITSMAKDQGKVLIIYPKNVNSERDLSECPEYTACSTVHRRLWFPPLIERHCRCKRPDECSRSWADYSNDTRTMALTNRAQLKFCENVKKLSRCKENDVALTVNEDGLMHKVSKGYLSRDKTSLRATPHTAQAHCFCQEPHYWRAARERGEFYCSQLHKCQAHEFCGPIRKDHHSTYYVCSCPQGHQCLSKDKATSKLNLPLYSGPTYSGFCQPITG